MRGFRSRESILSRTRVGCFGAGKRRRDYPLFLLLPAGGGGLGRGGPAGPSGVRPGGACGVLRGASLGGRGGPGACRRGAQGSRHNIAVCGGLLIRIGFLIYLKIWLLQLAGVSPGAKQAGGGRSSCRSEPPRRHTKRHTRRVRWSSHIRGPPRVVPQLVRHHPWQTHAHSTGSSVLYEVNLIKPPPNTP